MALSGCAYLFGWDIHAPGILSENFIQSVPQLHERVALYFPPNLITYTSKNRGGRFADPQTYHVGEAYAPMLVEAFQAAFDEFVLLETEPTPEILKQYGISYLVVTEIAELGNQVTLKGQAIVVRSKTMILDSQMKPIETFSSSGVSDAKKVFSKKGGPQVNLNVAIENNIMTVIEYVQDVITKSKS